jgi:hypothetical protein
MPSIKENLDRIKYEIAQTAVSCGRNPGDIQLIAVSKRQTVEKIVDAIKGGAGHLGENYIQEAMEKIDHIGRQKACWHFIGHLQSNKARFAVQYFDYIHTVDTLKLAREINKQAQKINKVQKILLQVNIADERTKSGTRKESAIDLADQVREFQNLSVRGLMCMPPYFPDPEKARIFFRHLAQMRDRIQDSIGHPEGHKDFLNHLSMGMSNDFRVAVEEGSTMVRVGTSIFGERD